MAKETYAYGKRDPCIWQKRPIHFCSERSRCGLSCDGRLRCTRSHVASSMLQWQKLCHPGVLPCQASCLCVWQKRPMRMAKETYAYGKRDLFISAQGVLPCQAHGLPHFCTNYSFCIIPRKSGRGCLLWERTLAALLGPRHRLPCASLPAPSLCPSEAGSHRIIKNKTHI